MAVSNAKLATLGEARGQAGPPWTLQYSTGPTSLGADFEVLDTSCSILGAGSPIYYAVEDYTFDIGPGSKVAALKGLGYCDWSIGYGFGTILNDPPNTETVSIEFGDIESEVEILCTWNDGFNGSFQKSFYAQISPP